MTTPASPFTTGQTVTLTSPNRNRYSATAGEWPVTIEKVTRTRVTVRHQGANRTFDAQTGAQVPEGPLSIATDAMRTQKERDDELLVRFEEAVRAAAHGNLRWFNTLPVEEREKLIAHLDSLAKPKRTPTRAADTATETYASIDTDTDINGNPVWVAIIHYAGRKRTDSILKHSEATLRSSLKNLGVTDIRPIGNLESLNR